MVEGQGPVVWMAGPDNLTTHLVILKGRYMQQNPAQVDIYTKPFQKWEMLFMQIAEGFLHRNNILVKHLKRL